MELKFSSLTVRAAAFANSVLRLEVVKHALEAMPSFLTICSNLEIRMEQAPMPFCNILWGFVLHQMEW